ncbi:hypothetical protein [Flavihumibacter sp. CACIAM 22H1]|uniref:hypothetical protein n=1 Tax=Flavihumibacter sp. CACIAM 22H1 TaxID=1812911 RepID=UPI0007A840CC|nr:hypothetical protein [Flavihumibacter sp. CACIAM 22H1]KYP13735.1 MAG: hypothetical protein A1D16_04500 [Flavihumibacter sp. CACIAM 22H1]
MKKKNTNCLQYAIWIDLQKAVIACKDDAGKLSTETFRSEIDTRVRFDGEGSNKNRLFGATLNQEKHAQNKLQQQRKNYLKEVVGKLAKAESVIILGPADTKYELHKEMEKKKALSQIPVQVKSADKMKIHELKAVLNPDPPPRSAGRIPRTK